MKEIYNLTWDMLGIVLNLGLAIGVIMLIIILVVATLDMIKNNK